MSKPLSLLKRALLAAHRELVAWERLRMESESVGPLSPDARPETATIKLIEQALEAGPDEI